MNHEMVEVYKELKQQRQLLEEINLAVTGSTKLGIKGFAKRLDSVESWRDQVNLRVAYTAGIVSGITFGGLEGVKALFNAITKH